MKQKLTEFIGDMDSFPTFQHTHQKCIGVDKSRKTGKFQGTYQSLLSVESFRALPTKLQNTTLLG